MRTVPFVLATLQNPAFPVFVAAAMQKRAFPTSLHLPGNAFLLGQERAHQSLTTRSSEQRLARGVFSVYLASPRQPLSLSLEALGGCGFLLGGASLFCYDLTIMTLADLPAVQQLSREEQLELVADLWDYIAAQPDDDLLSVSAEEAALLDQRLTAHQAAPESALSLEEFKRRLTARL